MEGWSILVCFSLALTIVSSDTLVYMFIVVQLGNINQSIDDLHMNSIQKLFEFER